jgi:DNA modification methylase
MRRPIDNNSVAGDGIYDPFLGSGTTMVACEQSGRVCFGMELDPGYAAVVLERLSGMGLEPRLSDGPQR